MHLRLGVRFDVFPTDTERRFCWPSGEDIEPAIVASPVRTICHILPVCKPKPSKNAANPKSINLRRKSFICKRCIGHAGQYWKSLAPSVNAAFSQVAWSSSVTPPCRRASGPRRPLPQTCRRCMYVCVSSWIQSAIWGINLVLPSTFASYSFTTASRRVRGAQQQ